MEADAYADSSFLVSLYRADSHHQLASRFLAKNAFALAFTPLHRIEVRNALRNAAAAGEITKAECAGTFRQIDEDLRDGFLLHAQISWTATFRRADELSEKYAASEGQRTLDLLHVAAALECGIQIFLSFDNRQQRLARVAGLTLRP